LTLGHFGLPHMAGRKADVRTFEDAERKGLTASIPGRQVAFMAYNGWDCVKAQVHRGFNAEAEESTVLGAYRKRIAKNPPIELMITVMLHKTYDTEWTKKELAPLRSYKILEVMPSGSVMGAELELSSGQKLVVDFKDVDGFKAC
jgi:hypothetical protein